MRKSQLHCNTHIPGLDPLAHTKTTSDANLAPFSETSSKMIQQDSQLFYSINTDHAAWCPGLCKNISMYEGRFLTKVTCAKQKDPKRTRILKKRKLLAEKKRKAYKRKFDLNEKKRSKLFSEVVKPVDEKNLPNSLEKSCQSRKTNILINVQQDQCLRGGSSRKKKSSPKCDELQLLNEGSDCFVNSVVQLMRQSDYASFLKMYLPNLLINASEDDYKLSRSLAELFFEKPRGKALSTAKIRSLVSVYSKKPYFDNKTQQDAEEFFRELEAMLTDELVSEEFLNFRGNHWGQEKRSRKFITNSENGECNICGKVPASKETPFLILQLDIPRTVLSVSLSSILNSHFSENPRIVSMRCPYCCESQEHEKNVVSCPKSGVCKARSTTEVSELIKVPKFLFIQLTRNVGDKPKISTFVQFNNELILPNGDLYEPVATLDHRGDSPVSGHYVTFLKLEDTWVEFNDDVVTKTSLENANNKNNYLLLFKMKSEKTAELNEIEMQQSKDSKYQQEIKEVLDHIQILEAKLMKTKEEKKELSQKKTKLKNLKLRSKETEEKKNARKEKTGKT